MIVKKVSNRLDDNYNEDPPVGPLEIARENLEVFADNFITQDSLVRMVEWYRVLVEVLKDNSLSEIEKKQTLEEIEYFEKAWSTLADVFLEKGISA